jgi:hypothetical protein
MYPYISLKIQNYVPHLYYAQSEENVRKLTFKDEDISSTFEMIAKELGLFEESTTFEDLLLLASEADDKYFENSPNINIEELEFQLQDIMTKVLNVALDEKTIDYKTEDLTEELKKEIVRNHNMDIMASLFDIAYKIIIAKTLLAAYDLEISNIHLETDYSLPRFTEKMAKELEDLGLEFSLDNFQE